MSSHGLDHRYTQTHMASTAARAQYASKINGARCANADGPRYVSPRDGYTVWAFCVKHSGHGCPVRGEG